MKRRHFQSKLFYLQLFNTSVGTVSGVLSDAVREYFGKLASENKMEITD